MERDARPLSPKGHRLLADAAHEEINQGRMRWGLPVLLGLHTGLRRRVLVHYQDDWRETTNNGDQIRVPKQIECPLRDEGCRPCRLDQTRGPDGFLRPKTGQGEQRVIPLPETWADSWSGDTRETRLSAYLDHYFQYNSTWGYQRTSLNNAVHRVASRRHEELVRIHEGAVERDFGNSRKRAVPDITPHDLRASWCTQCLRCGVNETTLMDWGGWKNSSMIQHYRGFVGDPGGTNRAMIEGTDSSDNPDDANLNMQAVYRVYSRLTEGKQVEPHNYTPAVLEAAYEMVQAE